jgi:hypothetical protein
MDPSLPTRRSALLRTGIGIYFTQIYEYYLFGNQVKAYLDKVDIVSLKRSKENFSINRLNLKK